MYTILILGVNNAINKTLRVCTAVETFKTSLLKYVKSAVFLSPVTDRIFLISSSLLYIGYSQRVISKPIHSYFRIWGLKQPFYTF